MRKRDSNDVVYTLYIYVRRGNVWGVTLTQQRNKHSQGFVGVYIFLLIN